MEPTTPELPAAGGNPLEAAARAQQKSDVPDFGPGDQVRVWCKIIEQDRVRLSPFEGVVIRRRGSGLTETFTVRRMTFGEGVERVFPAHAPVIDHIEVLRTGKVRRARLYFLRTRIGKTRIASTAEGSAGKPTAEGRLPAEPERSEAPSQNAA
ncbi:MAG: 50S ribosomal protein L19 [Candidatus Omnitrophica bacterium]|nr:50S ribosomal protein L19 [Candidatus Omnitrophota bacterium]